MRKRELNEKELESIKRILFLIDTECEGKAQAFADKVGIAKASVSHYKHHLHAPSQDHAFLISKAFNINPMWVMGFDVPMKQTLNGMEKPARIIMELTKDAEMVKALETYLSLSQDAKRHVIDTIKLLGSRESVAD